MHTRSTLVVLCMLLGYYDTPLVLASMHTTRARSTLLVVVDFISKYFRGREISGIAVWERGLSLTPTHPPFPRPAGSAGRGERMGLKSGPPKKSPSVTQVLTDG